MYNAAQTQNALYLLTEFLLVACNVFRFADFANSPNFDRQAQQILLLQ